MSQATSRSVVTALGAAGVLLLSLGASACGHKAPPPPPVAPAASAAPAAAPTITLQASPTAINAGGSSTLTWASTNAVRVELNGEAVNLNGSQPVSPTQSTDYQAIATNADGTTANAAVRITVSEPPPPKAAPAPAAENISTLFNENVRDAFFDYDKSTIRPDAQQSLASDATFFKSHPGINVDIVGHCDDRGSAEYNLALGSRRADAVKQYLVSQGVDASRISTTSVGKEDPFCTEQSQDCWQQNRRGHFSPPNQ